MGDVNQNVTTLLAKFGNFRYPRWGLADAGPRAALALFILDTACKFCPPNFMEQEQMVASLLCYVWDVAELRFLAWKIVRGKAQLRSAAATTTTSPAWSMTTRTHCRQQSHSFVWPILSVFLQWYCTETGFVSVWPTSSSLSM